MNTFHSSFEAAQSHAKRASIKYGCCVPITRCSYRGRDGWNVTVPDHSAPKQSDAELMELLRAQCEAAGISVAA